MAKRFMQIVKRVQMIVRTLVDRFGGRPSASNQLTQDTPKAFGDIFQCDGFDDDRDCQNMVNVTEDPYGTVAVVFCGSHSGTGKGEWGPIHYLDAEERRAALRRCECGHDSNAYDCKIEGCEGHAQHCPQSCAGIV